jgi:hypothetical protein
MAEPQPREAGETKLRALAEMLDAQYPFGPLFFATQLRAFIRDRCPDPRSGLPELELHLADGQALNVCHIMVIAPAWIAIAVDERSPSQGTRRMRTEIVPYAMIARISISTDRASGGQLGFDVNRTPVIAVEPGEVAQSAEQAFLAARGCSTP